MNDRSLIDKHQVASSPRSTDHKNATNRNASAIEHHSPFYTKARIMQLQKTIGNQATIQLLKSQMQVAPIQKVADEEGAASQQVAHTVSNSGPIQLMVDKDLKVATLVETLDGKAAKVIKETETGYKVVILDGKAIKEFTYAELNMPETINQLPKDFMTGLFKEHKDKSAGDRMKIATTTMDELFAKASKVAQGAALPFVKSYSWLALGSFGRQEMCPFSDIELGIVYLVDPEYQQGPDHMKIKENFNKLGATVLDRLQKIAAFITLDSEGNFPSGKGAGTLMGDAGGLAKSIAVASVQDSMDARHTMLMDARYLPATGTNDEAFRDFLAAKSDTMSEKLSDSEEVTQGDLNASHLAKLAINSLEMGITDHNKQSRFVDIKKNFRQPLDWSLMALCVKHGLFAPVGYLQRLDALMSREVIDGDLAGRIAKLFDLIFTTRIDLHMHHNEELDTVDTNPDKKEETGGFEADKIVKISSSGKGHEALYIAELFMGVAKELLVHMKSIL